MYDIIGDIHGSCSTLCALMVKKLGYEYDGKKNVFVHPEGRKPLFIGDIINRGTQNIKTYQIIRTMVDKGLADLIMGNHEFNAILWHMPDPDTPGEFLRKHTDENLAGHTAFIQELEDNPELWQEMLGWFKILPLYKRFDDGKAIAVHACWDHAGIKALEEGGYLNQQGVLTKKAWKAIAAKDKDVLDKIRSILRGPKEKLEKDDFVPTEGYKNDGKARCRWWMTHPKKNKHAFIGTMLSKEFAKQAYDSGRDKLSEAAQRIRDNLKFLGKQTVVFIGHYSITDEDIHLSDKVFCVDTGCGKGNHLTAYRYDPANPALNTKNIVSTKPIEPGSPEYGMAA